MAWRTNVLWAVNANWNSDGLNVEANSIDNPNEWNAGNRFLSRNPIFFSPAPDYRGGFFVSKPFFHPPTMRPISSTSFPSEIK